MFAVPGPALSPGSEGVHALIRDGAKLVTKAEDIIDELRSDVRALLQTRERPPSTNNEALDDTERKLLAKLVEAQTALDVDTLIDRAELPVPTTLAALSRLEVKGRIWSLAGGLYQVKP